MLSNKRSLRESKRAQLNLNCNAILSRTLPSKLKDLKKFNILYILGKKYPLEGSMRLGSNRESHAAQNP
jgi:hypothetical protein